MRGTHHGDVVAKFSGIFGEPQSFDRGLDAGAGNQHFVGSGCFAGRLQNIALLLIGEHERLARRPEHDDARDRSPRVALDVGLKLFIVDVAVGIERRGDGRKNSVEKHNSGYQF